jgi:hypothetical protein
MKLDYSIDITQQGERKKLLGLLIYMFILTLILLLAGCGLVKYSTEAYIDGVKKVEVKSNVPSKVTVDGIEVDQRSSGSWFDKLFPQNVKIEK